MTTTNVVQGVVFPKFVAAVNMEVEFLHAIQCKKFQCQFAICDTFTRLINHSRSCPNPDNCDTKCQQIHAFLKCVNEQGGQLDNISNHINTTYPEKYKIHNPKMVAPFNPNGNFNGSNVQQSVVASYIQSHAPNQSIMQSQHASNNTQSLFQPRPVSTFALSQEFKTSQYQCVTEQTQPAPIDSFTGLCTTRNGQSPVQALQVPNGEAFVQSQDAQASTNQSQMQSHQPIQSLPSQIYQTSINQQALANQYSMPPPSMSVQHHHQSVLVPSGHYSQLQQQQVNTTQSFVQQRLIQKVSKNPAQLQQTNPPFIRTPQQHTFTTQSFMQQRPVQSGQYNMIAQQTQELKRQSGFIPQPQAFANHSYIQGRNVQNGEPKILAQKNQPLRGQSTIFPFQQGFTNQSVMQPRPVQNGQSSVNNQSYIQPRACKNGQQSYMQRPLARTNKSFIQNPQQNLATEHSFILARNSQSLMQQQRQLNVTNPYFMQQQQSLMNRSLLQSRAANNGHSIMQLPQAVSERPFVQHMQPKYRTTYIQQQNTKQSFTQPQTVPNGQANMMVQQTQPLTNQYVMQPRSVQNGQSSMMNQTFIQTRPSQNLISPMHAPSALNSQVTVPSLQRLPNHSLMHNPQIANGNTLVPPSYEEAIKQASIPNPTQQSASQLSPYQVQNIQNGNSMNNQSFIQPQLGQIMRPHMRPPPVLDGQFAAPSHQRLPNKSLMQSPQTKVQTCVSPSYEEAINQASMHSHTQQSASQIMPPQVQQIQAYNKTVPTTIEGLTTLNINDLLGSVGNEPTYEQEAAAASISEPTLTSQELEMSTDLTEGSGVGYFQQLTRILGDANDKQQQQQSSAADQFFTTKPNFKRPREDEDNAIHRKLKQPRISKKNVEESDDATGHSSNGVNLNSGTQGHGSTCQEVELEKDFDDEDILRTLLQDKPNTGQAVGAQVLQVNEKERRFKVIKLATKIFPDFKLTSNPTPQSKTAMDWAEKMESDLFMNAKSKDEYDTRVTQLVGSQPNAPQPDPFEFNSTEQPVALPAGLPEPGCSPLEQMINSRQAHLVPRGDNDQMVMNEGDINPGDYLANSLVEAPVRKVGSYFM